jgi:hypothetical protein
MLIRLLYLFMVRVLDWLARGDAVRASNHGATTGTNRTHKK